MKVLAVAAWEPELARLRARVGEAPVPGVELTLAAAGVGLVESAVGVTLAIVAAAPDVAVLLGTCGAFAPAPPGPGEPAVARAPALAIGEVVVGARVRLVDGAALAGDAELPGPMPAEASLDATLHAALVAAGARSVTIANTVGITVGDAHAARLARAAGAEVEHLEAFAFARACAAGAVPALVVLGVANAVGARGREEWKRGHVEASARAGDRVYESLAELARARAGAPIRTSTTAPSKARG